MSLQEISSLQDYAALLQKDKQEPKALLKDLLISVTNFFRDPEAIEALAATVVPAILQRKDENDFLRVWVAGCATGEEAYSFGLMLERARMSRAGFEYLVEGWDVDPISVAAAEAGRYPLQASSQIAPELRSLVVPDAAQDAFAVTAEIRRRVRFGAVRGPVGRGARRAVLRPLLVARAR